MSDVYSVHSALGYRILLMSLNDPAAMKIAIDIVRAEILRLYFERNEELEQVFFDEGTAVCCDLCGEFTLYSHSNDRARCCISDECIERAVRTCSTSLHLAADLSSL